MKFTISPGPFHGLAGIGELLDMYAAYRGVMRDLEEADDRAAYAALPCSQ